MKCIVDAVYTIALKIIVLPGALKRNSLIWRLALIGLLATACKTPDLAATPTSPPRPVETTAALPTQSPATATATPAALTATPPATPTLPPTATPIIIDESLSTVGYGLPLTIRHVTTTTATFFFKLEAPAAGRLFYWPAGAEEPPAWRSLTATASRQQITLEELRPGVAYQAVVGVLGEDGRYRQPHYMDQEWGVVNFRTASDEQLLRVGVVGDSGLGEAATLDLTELMTAYNLDFVLHAGDLVYLMQQNSSPFEAYALKYYTTFAPLLHRLPLYPVVGNHDIEPATLWQGVPFYYYVFPSLDLADLGSAGDQNPNQWYSIDYGSFQFLLLDTQTLFGEAGGAEQDAWLAERLADDRFWYTIPVFHVPLYSSGQRPEEGLVVQQAWAALFAEANVPLVLSGHEHFYERLSVAGLTQVISGGGTSVLYPVDERVAESQALAQEMHFVLLELYPDRIELSAISRDGLLLDQYSIHISAN